LWEISTSHPSEKTALEVLPEDAVTVALPWVVDDGTEVSDEGRKSRTGLRAILAAIIGVLVVVAGAWRVTDSALFHMRSLHVKGARHLGAQEVGRLGGLGPGTNVLWLRPGSVAAAIRQDPWVLSVRVSRTLPSTITIEVVERTPVAAVAGSPPLLVASDGVVLGPAGPHASLPLISAPTTPAIGGRLPATIPALAVLAALPAGLRGAVTQVGVDATTGLTLTLRDGARVVYGDASDAAAKGAALDAVLSWARANDVIAASIDVRVPGAPALVPGAAAVPGPPPGGP
jgi:cell division protein FtsQ